MAKQPFIALFINIRDHRKSSNTFTINVAPDKNLE